MKGIAQEKQCIGFNPIPEKKAKNRKSAKNVKYTPFGVMSRTPRGYLGHKFGVPGCPIFIRRYMQIFTKILRAVSEKFEVFQKVSIGKKLVAIAAIVLRNKFPSPKKHSGFQRRKTFWNIPNVLSARRNIERGNIKEIRNLN